MAAVYENSEGEWVPVPEPVPLEHVIRGALLNALAYTEGDQQAAGRWLGVSPHVMSHQMHRYGIPTNGLAWRRGRRAPMRRRSVRAR